MLEDCKVAAGENIARRHRIGICRLTLAVTNRERVKAEPKIKRWK